MCPYHIMCPHVHIEAHIIACYKTLNQAVTVSTSPLKKGHCIYCYYDVQSPSVNVFVGLFYFLQCCPSCTSFQGITNNLNERGSIVRIHLCSSG